MDLLKILVGDKNIYVTSVCLGLRRKPWHLMSYWQRMTKLSFDEIMEYLIETRGSETIYGSYTEGALGFFKCLPDEIMKSIFNHCISLSNKQHNSFDFGVHGFITCNKYLFNRHKEWLVRNYMKTPILKLMKQGPELLYMTREKWMFPWIELKIRSPSKVKKVLRSILVHLPDTLEKVTFDGVGCPNPYIFVYPPNIKTIIGNKRKFEEE